LDGAHNPAAARALAEVLPDTFTWDRLHLVLGVFAGKDLEGIVAPLAPLADAGYATAVDSVRARPPREVADALAVHGIATQHFASVPDALDAAARAASDGDLILVTGSLYTVADARRALLGDP
jgi:dihydrofolate synthase / folylpolyglutamate synthase